VRSIADFRKEELRTPLNGKEEKIIGGLVGGRGVAMANDSSRQQEEEEGFNREGRESGAPRKEKKETKDPGRK